MMVSIYAIGSFEPLSSSSSGLRLCFRCTFCEPRMPNTEAESVDDMVAASRIDGISAKCMLVHGIPDSQKMNRPVNSVVSSTPSVLSTRPGAMTGLIDLKLVDRPPE